MVIGKVKIDPGSYLLPNVVSLGVVHDDHGQHGHLPGHEEDVVVGNLKLNLILKYFVLLILENEVVSLPQLGLVWEDIRR